ASTGERALTLAARRPPDLVVLDLGLPDRDGVEVIHGLRSWSSAPIIVLSGRPGSADKVAALDAGADDYVTKPFGTDELLARLRAAIRRATVPPEAVVVPFGDLTVDLAARRVVRGAAGDLRLTPTEWQVLEVLIRNPGRLITHRQLLTEIWGPGGYPPDNDYLRVYLARLRRKLEPVPSRPRYLITEPGIGYRFQP
ncbi:MAG TPA: winged helix-turn-helix domain-containing protein, partial [Kineosporiaceae bacterium]|nr:winged helix-turn-helix domain-containing protein [Kineosporiaceae bacterium]